MFYRKKLFVWFFITFSVLILTYFSNPFSFYVHGITNTFAGGRSTSKVYAFLLYLAVLFLIAIFSSKFKLLRSKNLDKKILIYSIGSLFLLGFLGLLYFFNKYGFVITDYVATFHNNEFSSTSIAHNHIGKGLIGYILSFFGYSHFEFIDAGHAFMGLMPRWFYILFGVNLLVSLIYTFIVFITESSKRDIRILYILLYAILSFSVLEHTFDGGLFDPRVPILYILFAILLFGIPKKKIRPIILVFILSTALSFVYFKFKVISDEDTLKRIVLSIVSYFGVFIIPLILLHRKFERRTVWILYIFSFTLVLPFLFSIDNLKTYRSARIDTESSYLAIYKTDKEVPFKILDKYGDLILYEVPPGKFKNLGEMINNYGLLDNILPATVPWVTCFPMGLPRSLNFVLETNQPLTRLKYESKFVQADFLPISDFKNMKRYQGKIEMNGCLPRFVNVLEEVIKSLGTKTFILTNITNGNYHESGINN